MMKYKTLWLTCTLLAALSSFAPPEKNLNVVFIGDSITYGVLLKKAPPMYAYDYLVRQKNIGRVSVSNQGVSGYTTVNFLPRTGSVFRQVEQAADTLMQKNKGDLIFSVMLGTNDSAEDGPAGSPVSPAAYRANLQAITDRLLTDYPHCKVVINDPIWYSPNTYNGARYLQAGLNRLQSYFPEIRQMVSDEAVAHPGRVFSGEAGVFDYFEKNYRSLYTPQSGHQGTFYLHPNARGAEKLGTCWGKAIYLAAFH